MTKRSGEATPVGELQAAILQVLWERNEVSAADVHAALADRGLAPTTVATMLAKMERRGLIAHRAEGRRFLFHAVADEASVRRSMVTTVARRLFNGSISAMVNHLLSEHRLSRRELDTLKTAIESRRKDKAR